MSERNRCPECGTELPPGTLEGLCPKCLMAAGLDSGVASEAAAGGVGSDAPTTPHSGSFVPPYPEALAAHFPQLEILELLGHGGMGAVYKARQPRLDRLVALKIIRPESTDAPEFAERFNREARMLARLSHPQIVAVYDFGEVKVSDADDSGQQRPLYFFLMEYVDGASLRQVMQTGELTPPQALAIVPQICEALQFAHDEGVVHRDIKPENILLDKRGRVKIADFGLAKPAARSAAEFTLTGTHQVMGTPRYMAPEQMEGSRAVDHRADIYSLGVVFYEMLTGEVPAGHFEPPSRKVQIDVQLDEVVLRALAREPERRYQHVNELKTDVESISNVASSAAGRPASQVGIAAAAVVAKPYPWTALWIGLALLASVSGLIAFAMYWTSSPWPLLGLALPWFAAGAIFGMAGGGDKEVELLVPAVLLHLGATFLASLALVAYAIVLIDSAMPLWMVALCAAAIVAGGGIGYAAATDSESDPTSDKGSEAEGEASQDKAVAANSDSEVPGGPMILVGTLATITLVSSGGDDLLAWLRGGSPSFESQWQFLLGGPLVVLGGMAMLQRRAYWLAIVASIACLPLGLGSENIVIRLIPLALGLYSLYWLMQPEVREAFGYAGRSQAAAAAVTMDQPPSPSAQGTILRAWEEWWAERDGWLTRGVLTVLLVVHVACFAMFSALGGGGGYEDGRAFAWHHVGWPTPWFVYELGKEPNVYFQRTINFLASSMLIAAVGMLAWYAFWRIQLVRDASHARLWRTIGSPTAIFILWALAGAALATLGANDAERLYERMRTTKAQAEAPQSGNFAAEAHPSG